jgi:Ig-like domain from next to BRCA1 gene
MKFRKSHWLVSAVILAVILSSCTLGATPVPTQDVGVVQTKAYSIVLTQVAMQQTQTALAVPSPLPTNTLAPLPTQTLGTLPTFAPIGGIGTPFAFNTQQPGFTPLASPISTLGIVSTVTTKNGCNDGSFIGETAPMDKDVIIAEKKFSKGWSIFNTGTCTWDEGYSFTFMPQLSSPELKGYSIVLKKDAPDEYTAPQHSQTFIVKLVAPKAAGEYKGYWKLKDDAGNFFGPLVSLWIIVK